VRLLRLEQVRVGGKQLGIMSIRRIVPLGLAGALVAEQVVVALFSSEGEPLINHLRDFHHYETPSHSAPPAHYSHAAVTSSGTFVLSTAWFRPPTDSRGSSTSTLFAY
jgi:hypothetical protein